MSQNNQKRGRKCGRMLRKKAFQRYWSPFFKDGVRYQHRLEYHKVRNLVANEHFDNVEDAKEWWRENRHRNNKNRG